MHAFLWETEKKKDFADMIKDLEIERLFWIIHVA